MAVDIDVVALATVADSEVDTVADTDEAVSVDGALDWAVVSLDNSTALQPGLSILCFSFCHSKN